MATTTEQIDQWRVVRSEDQNLEFKEAKNQYDTRKLCQYCAAIANEGGGHLLLGIEDKPPRKVVSTAAFPDLVHTAGKLFKWLGFRVDVEAVAHPEGRVLVFDIPSRPRGTVYKYDNVIWMRAGEDLVSMSEDRLRKIFDEGKPDWFSQVAMAGCDDKAVFDLLDIQSYFKLLGFPTPTEHNEIMDRFVHEGFIQRGKDGWGITNLAAILLAKRLESFHGLDHKAVRFVIYDGFSKVKTKVDHQEKKGYAIGFQGLVMLIDDRIPSNEIIEQALRRQVKMFPQIAIRELVANALIHQDFSETGMSVMVELYDDRLEISNPGKPLIQADRFIDIDKSRNERLAKIMRKLGICEEKGSGIDKVVEASEVYQLPAPDFRSNELRTTAVMYCHKDFEDMDRSDRIRACYQHCCLHFVTNRKMTNQTLRERFRLSENQSSIVSQIIKATIEAGRIKIANAEPASKKFRQYTPYWA